LPLPQNIVIGSGPNGLSAAIVLARAGRPVTLYEQSQEIGGGTRTEELTLPGFLHDVCSAVHPMAASSPCFDEFGLAPYGLEWVHAPSPLAHPLDDGTAVVLERSLDATAGQLGAADGAAWRGLFGRLAAEWMDLRQDLLRPLSLFWHPVRKARFGFSAVRSARGLAWRRRRQPPHRRQPLTRLLLRRRLRII
jgi:phytoene dehydrogenase-like protein